MNLPTDFKFPARLRWALAVFAGLVVLVFAYAIWQAYQANRYAKETERLNNEIKQAQLKASNAEGQAIQSKQAAEGKERELTEAQVRAEAADRALDQARNLTVTVRQKYEETRNPSRPVDPVSIADACTKLAELGYPCK